MYDVVLSVPAFAYLSSCPVLFRFMLSRVVVSLLCGGSQDFTPFIAGHEFLVMYFHLENPFFAYHGISFTMLVASCDDLCHTNFSSEG